MNAQAIKSSGSTAGDLGRSLSNLGYVFGVLLLVVAPIGIGLWWLEGIGSQPVARVEVLTPLHFVTRQQLVTAIGEDLNKGFHRLDLEAMRRGLMQLPWVEGARIRRVWPDTVELEISERVPLARWGQGGELVSFNGDRFRPRADSVPGGLPLLGGPEDSVPRVVEQHGRFAELLSVAGIGIATVAVDTRGAWRVELRNGLGLLLGRHRMEQRLWRLARVYGAVLQERLSEIEQVDLRYSNGFAVRWRSAD